MKQYWSKNGSIFYEFIIGKEIFFGYLNKKTNMWYMIDSSFNKVKVYDNKLLEIKDYFLDFDLNELNFEITTVNFLDQNLVLSSSHSILICNLRNHSFNFVQDLCPSDLSIVSLIIYQNKYILYACEKSKQVNILDKEFNLVDFKFEIDNGYISKIHSEDGFQIKVYSNDFYQYTFSY